MTYISTSEIQYPTEPYNPQKSPYCTQPSVGLGDAITTPIPLGPPRLPSPPAPRYKLKWQTRQHANEETPTEPGKPFLFRRMINFTLRPRSLSHAYSVTPPDSFSRMLLPAASQFQSSERVSVRLAARDGSTSSPLSTSVSPDLSENPHSGPQGQPFEQQSNSNGKRALQDDGGGVKGKGRKKKKAAAGPDSLPSQPHNAMGMPVHVPMHMAMNGGGTPAIPLDPSFFTGPGPSHSSVGGGAYSDYPPLATHLSDPSQQAGPSNSHNYTLETLPPPGQLTPELQFARCMSNRYKPDPFPRCVSCTRRWAGDTCRFQGIR